MGGGQSGGWNDQHVSLGDLELPAVKDQIRAKPLWFITKGFVTMIKKDNAVYNACSGDGCNKKLVGMWGCARVTVV